MIFKKLKIENIRSYENLEIEFPKGSILLSGNIGAGKTSILLALQFALFGLQPGQKGASILRHGKDTAYVYLEFEIDGKTIEIERTIKKSKSGSITQESNIITIDNKKEELSTSEMKNKIITLLDYPKEFIKKSNLLYTFTVYTPQEEMKEIIQERPEIRLDTLRHVFGIDRYKRIKENSQTLLQKIKESVKLKEGQVLELNSLKEILSIEKEKKIKLSREANNLSLSHKETIQEKIKAEKNIESIQKTIEEKRILELELSKNNIILQGKKDVKQRTEKEIILLQKQTSQKIDFSEENLDSVSRIVEQHKKTLDESNSRFVAVNSRISVLNSKKEDSKKLSEKVASIDNCPTCHQAVSQEHKERITKKSQYDIDEINIELQQKIFDRQQLLKDIEKEKELIKNYEADLLKLQQDKIKFEHQKNIETKIKSEIFVLERTSNEIVELEKKITETEQNLKNYSASSEIFEVYKQQFENISQKVRQEEILIATKNKELEILKQQIEKREKDILLKENILLQIHYLRELQDWFQEKFLSMITITETSVLAKLRQEFSKIFSEWFSMLVSDSLLVRLDEDFTPIISNQDYEIDYAFLSGGERTAVALAYRLALNQVLNSLLSRIKTKGLVILDEPTDGFSEEQLEKMRDIFEQLEAEQTILVSHEQKIEGFVDHIIRIKKDGNSSIESIKQ